MLCACGGPADQSAGGAAAAGNGAGSTADSGVDLERGELLALSCRPCHTFGPGEGHLLGPNLHGLFGRRAAAVPDFVYSAAFQAADFVWTAEQLDAWLADPDGFLPGNDMPFGGFSSAADRRALIAYLLQSTAEAVP